MTFARLLRIIRQRLRSLFQRTQVDAELQGELAFHFDQLVQEHLAAGMSLDEARRAARRALGNIDLLQEECRDQRRLAWLDEFRRDVAHAFRLLLRSPAFTVVAVGSLALGIGANTAIFTLVYRALLESLPVKDPQNLVLLSRRNLESEDITSFPHPFFRELASQSSVFDGIACHTDGWIALGDDDGAQPALVELVSGNFFHVLGVLPLHGRLLTPDDDHTPGAHPVMVLSHNYWRRRFGSDPSIVGKTVRVNTNPMTVVGILPPGFDGLRPGFSPDGYIPVMMQAQVWLSRSQLDSRGHHWLRLFGRLRAGVTAAQAESFTQSFMLAYFEQNEGRTTLSPYARRVRQSERLELKPIGTGLEANRQLAKPLLIMLGVVASVLLIACVNLANLLLARNSSRRHEFAVRLSLGATRFRLLRQLLTESLMISFLGGMLGFGIALACGPVLTAMLVGYSPNFTLDSAPGRWVFAFNFAVAIICGLLFGLAPAWNGIQQVFTSGLREGRTVAGSRLLGRKLLLSGQVAVSLVLLIAAGLFLRTLASIKALDLGFQPEQVVQATLSPRTAGYEDDQVLPFFRQVKERLEATAGVRSAGFAVMRPMANNEWGSGITVEGFELAENDPGPSRNAVSPGYFKTMGIPLLMGRDFTPDDDANGAKVGIVNESFARFYFGDINPIGRRIGPGGSKGRPDHTIIGVVQDSTYRSFREDPTRVWYIPLDASPMRQATLYVRVEGVPQHALALVRGVIADIDKNVPLRHPKTFEQQIAEGFRQERLLATLSTFFALLAALLAAIGLFGVLSFSVNQRFREIGLRMALGASPRQVFGMVLRDVVAFGALGFALAAPAIYFMTRAIAALLFGVEPLDPITIAIASGVMALTALTAGFFPAYSASRIEPAITLSTD